MTEPRRDGVTFAALRARAQGVAAAAPRAVYVSVVGGRWASSLDGV